MNYQAPLAKTVSPYLLWFMIHKSQTGVAVLDFQSRIAQGAEQDSWVSVLLTGLSMHLVVLLMFYVLKHANRGDLVSLHVQLFGRGLGTLLNGVFLLYLLLLVCYQLITYSQVIQALVFPDMGTWRIGLVFLLLFVYITSGGFRVITGTAFWFVLIPSLLIVTLFIPLQYADWRNFLPMFNHSLPEYAYSAAQSLPLYIGVELLLMYYPFIRNNDKAQKWAHIGVMHTYLLYFVFVVATFAYYNMGQLRHSVWPTLGMSKIIQFTFLDRFDYFYIFNWVFVITPPCCLILWSCTRILRFTTRMSGRVSLWATAAVVFVIVAVFHDMLAIDRLGAVVRYAGTSLLFGYIPLLAVCVFIANRFRKSVRDSEA
ncbi:GerAB/ArcD/ProY family transporter [Paenibacillus sacheonensis]|uniref:GerAB/ArcD/ProY family transporter n=1 Tax=Paenibacillus sacheonensis TaxID=742054 RepID=A0A7X4YQ74_9BACL|nr:GerAB/ArcD/ProY family transporter [Paenibacillus sacheonensis]MBM7566258.1 spore germination protein (amino acid permease) [Paenibacillus sacheonensis]NBC70465.1 GerAB/ArcD/ProY family transporter [Paenibacillus sacheonensis]